MCIDLIGPIYSKCHVGLILYPIYIYIYIYIRLMIHCKTNYNKNVVAKGFLCKCRSLG